MKELLLILFLLSTFTSCAYKENSVQFNNSVLLGTIIGTLVSLQ